MSDALTQQALKQMLWYDSETGLFRWRNERNNGKIKPWSVAGSPDDRGYMQVCIGETHYRSHRLAWLYMMGTMPSDSIDHINMNKGDNRWCNLRAATSSQNKWNTALRKDNKTGVKGVRFVSGKYRAAVKVAGVEHYLGRFDTIDEAATVVQQFRSKHHGEFAKH